MQESLGNIFAKFQDKKNRSNYYHNGDVIIAVHLDFDTFYVKVYNFEITSATFMKLLHLCKYGLATKLPNFKVIY